MIYFITSLVCGFIAAYINVQKNRNNEGLAFASGFFLGIFGVLYQIFSESKPDSSLTNRSINGETGTVSYKNNDELHADSVQRFKNFQQFTIGPKLMQLSFMNGEPFDEWLDGTINVCEEIEHQLGLLRHNVYEDFFDHVKIKTIQLVTEQRMLKTEFWAESHKFSDYRWEEFTKIINRIEKLKSTLK